MKIQQVKTILSVRFKHVNNDERHKYENKTIKESNKTSITSHKMGQQINYTERHFKKETTSLQKQKNRTEMKK